MKIVITAATAGEWMPASLNLNTIFTTGNNKLTVSFHKSGVGMLSTAVSLMQLFYEEKPDLIIQIGIAGSFDGNMELGKVVAVNHEMLGDLGVMENGRWNDIFDMNLEQENQLPFENKALPNQWLHQFNLLDLQTVDAITINNISTNELLIKELQEKYHATIESMEGAALHYVCRQMNVPFLQLRSISNYVGERDKSKWQMKLAIENLNEVLIQLINRLNKTM